MKVSKKISLKIVKTQEENNLGGANTQNREKTTLLMMMSSSILETLLDDLCTLCPPPKYSTQFASMTICFLFLFTHTYTIHILISVTPVIYSVFRKKNCVQNYYVAGVPYFMLENTKRFMYLCCVE